MLKIKNSIFPRRLLSITSIIAFMVLGLILSSMVIIDGVATPTEDDESDSSNISDIFDIEDEEDNDHDDDGVEDDIEEANERELKIEVSSEEAKIASERKIGTQKDEIKIEVKTTDEPEVKVEYSSEVDSLEIELAFKIRFYLLAEYLDLDSNGVYNETIDELVQEIRLDSIDYEPISLQTVPGAGNTTLYIMNITSSNRIFSLQFYLANEFANVNGVLIAPTEVKLDIAINNFPFLNESSLLALELKLEAESEYKHEEDTEDEVEGRSENEEGVDVEMNGFFGFFSWNENAFIDGVITPILASPVSEDNLNSNEQKIYLNYPHGTNILHDPKIGVEGIIQAGSQSLTNGFLVPISIIALSVASGLFIRKKRR